MSKLPPACFLRFPAIPVVRGVRGPSAAAVTAGRPDVVLNHFGLLWTIRPCSSCPAAAVRPAAGRPWPTACLPVRGCAGARRGVWNPRRGKALAQAVETAAGRPTVRTMEAAAE
jgi:hypothetical protein